MGISPRLFVHLGLNLSSDVAKYFPSTTMVRWFLPEDVPHGIHQPQRHIHPHPRIIFVHLLKLGSPRQDDLASSQVRCSRMVIEELQRLSGGVTGWVYLAIARDNDIRETTWVDSKNFTYSSILLNTYLLDMNRIKLSRAQENELVIDFDFRKLKGIIADQKMPIQNAGDYFERINKSHQARYRAGRAISKVDFKEVFGSNQILPKSQTYGIIWQDRIKD